MKPISNQTINHTQTQLHARLAAVLAGFCLALSAEAQTITWQEDWESPVAQDNWYPDNGYWEIGVPTYGPPDRGDGWLAHQGTNVAATVLNGDYTDNRQSRLISSAISIPAAGQKPRLRFWHWWSFGCGDYGQVQISTNNGTSWVDLSGAYSADSSGRWSKGWLDLTPYGGKTVLLGLFFSSTTAGCGTTVSAGWYVDEITIETGEEAGLNPLEGFEAGWAGWKADYIGGKATEFAIWEIGVPTTGPGPAYAGTKCAATILNGNYPENRSARLVSQPAVVPAADQSPRLRFWHWWSFGCGDYGQVQISTNNGTSWVDLSGAYRADSSGRWSKGWLDLTPYGGKTVLLGLLFSSTTAGCGTTVGAGWYVDELTIETGDEPPIPSLESFEIGWGGWKANYIGGNATDYAIWEIGVPTTGPGPAHAGTNCAATVLNGNYPEDRDSRLVSPALVVPSANSNPRLRFWHWWSFACGDYGQVQISTNNGASWLGLSGGYSADSSGRWSRGWLDLTAYAGMTVRLGLYFHSQSAGCGGTVGAGWYVDELTIETGPEPSFNPSENFEVGWGGWKADYFGAKATDSAIWEIGVPTTGPGSAHAGTNAAATYLNGNYPEDRDSRLVSPPFVVPPAMLSPRLRFWHWWSFACGDYGQMQVSTNNGASWLILATYSTSSPWTRPQLDLIPYAGQTVRLGLNFHSQSAGCGGTVGAGWYVDEIRLLHDPALFLIGSPVVRTQDMACISLAIAVDSPASGASFVIQAPAGNLNNAKLSTEGCWSGTISPQSATEWLVNLQSSCTAGSAGVETIGTICFSAVSPHSAFVPLTVNNLVISNLPPAQAFGTRAVNIANEPLLESWLDTSGKRMATTYGKANTSYEIRYSTDADAPSPWLVGWSNTVPADLVIHSPVGGDMSNAPVLFLKAREQ
ncbi:MAG: hypothetical protein KJ070_10510 [Verrucomicrobia bacterium]|nr:hypothetical protein [Verrucomicrobiota bacterium]